MSSLFRDMRLNSEQLAAVEQAQSEQKKSAPEMPDFSQLGKADFLTGKAVYEHILTLDDEISVSDYIAQMSERARELGCKGCFESRVKPYKKQALKSIAGREREVRALETAERTDFPEWWNGSWVDEVLFCEEFLKDRELRCVNGTFYGINGIVPDDKLTNEIQTMIAVFCKRDIARRTRGLLEALKMKCYCKPIPPDESKIHVNNGTITLETVNREIEGKRKKEVNISFSEKCEFCTSRLNVTISDIDRFVRPNVWLDFLGDLLESEDIQTLQEYMGYCLLPTTKAQKMLLITGNGGEGKSRIGIVMKALLGEGLVSGEIADLDNGSKARFGREKLLGRLVLLDDDTDLAALGKTSFLKQLVTAEMPLEVEPKGRPSYQARLYTRVLAFGNGVISALHDNSDGFYRRQIILRAKPRPKERQDDRELSTKLEQELEDIFFWALRGLCRLIRNDFEFTISDKAKQNIKESRREGNNIFAFMDSEGYFEKDPKGSIFAKDLYDLYYNWCSDNGETPRKHKSFTRFLKDNCDKFGLKYGENVSSWSGRRARGFYGLKKK